MEGAPRVWRRCTSGGHRQNITLYPDGDRDGVVEILISRMSGVYLLMHLSQAELPIPASQPKPSKKYLYMCKRSPRSSHLGIIPCLMPNSILHLDTSAPACTLPIPSSTAPSPFRACQRLGTLVVCTCCILSASTRDSTVDPPCRRNR